MSNTGHAAGMPPGSDESVSSASDTVQVGLSNLPGTGAQISVGFIALGAVAALLGAALLIGSRRRSRR